MGPDPVHMSGSLELDDDVAPVLKRLERIGSSIMNRAGSPGMLGDNPIGAVLANPDKKRAAAQILGQAYVTAYALMAANRSSPGGHRRHADRAQGAPRRRGGRAARARGAHPARARSARSRHLAQRMTEPSNIAKSADESTVRAGVRRTSARSRERSQS